MMTFEPETLERGLEQLSSAIGGGARGL